jgi:nitroimidazol reductase NimA-like FMN-containing flavoprotein (pyridoxamine 5'-phosphate oxidase superfamily)
MSSTMNAPPPQVTGDLTRSQCDVILQRTCFGHLAVVQPDRVDLLPVRFACSDGWIYFRADESLSGAIARNPWLALSVTELRDPTHFHSVIVRGGCHPTVATGSAAGDEKALRGIRALRDRSRVGRSAPQHVPRTLIVYRLHTDEVRGTSTFVPCPAGDRPYDDVEVEILRTVNRDQSESDDARADDDGMAEPSAPVPPPVR